MALEIFAIKLDEMSSIIGVELAIIEVLEEDFGWVFLYQGRTYVESGDLTGVIIGNTPIIIDKADGSIHSTGTAYPVKHYIDEYRQKRSMTQ